MITTIHPKYPREQRKREREGERREKLQCMKDPSVPPSRARRRNAPSAGRREGAGTAPRWTAPHSPRRGGSRGEGPHRGILEKLLASGASLLSPPSPRSAPAPPASPRRLGPQRRARSAPLRSAGTARGSAGRGARGQPASPHLLRFVLFFSPLPTSTPVSRAKCFRRDDTLSILGFL